jgi:hypothetical protein
MDPLDDVSVHHYGVIVASIDAYLARSLWQPLSPVVPDPLQGARLCLAGLHPGMSPAIELVEPTGPDSPLREALERGTSWHHICFAAPTRARADEIIAAHRMLPVTGWKPAPLFAGRNVRFVYSRNRELVEFVSGEPPDGDG